MQPDMSDAENLKKKGSSYDSRGNAASEARKRCACVRVAANHGYNKGGIFVDQLSSRPGAHAEAGKGAEGGEAWRREERAGIATK